MRQATSSRTPIGASTTSDMNAAISAECAQRSLPAPAEAKPLISIGWFVRLMPGLSWSFTVFQKFEQIADQLVLVAGEDAVSTVVIFNQLGAPNGLGCFMRREGDRHGLVSDAVNHQRWHGEVPEVLPKVRLGKGAYTGERRPQAGIHRLAPCIVEHRLAELALA